MRKTTAHLESRKTAGNALLDASRALFRPTDSEEAKIDFSRVDVMTPSFADECFGKLAEQIGADNFRATVSLVGVNETIRALVNSVLAERLSRVRRAQG